MFYLKDLPTDTTLDEFSRRYPYMNPSAIKTFAELLRTGSDLLTAFETILAKSGLSQGRFLTLIVMNRTPHEEVNPSFLADRVGVRRPTMTGLLDKLEKDGLVERRAYRRDRRKMGVRLTENGRRILDDILPEYYRNIAKITVRLTEKERMDLIMLLGKVKQGLWSLSES